MSGTDANTCAQQPLRLDGHLDRSDLQDYISCRGIAIILIRCAWAVAIDETHPGVRTAIKLSVGRPDWGETTPGSWPWIPSRFSKVSVSDVEVTSRAARFQLESCETSEKKSTRAQRRPLRPSRCYRLVKPPAKKVISKSEVPRRRRRLGSLAAVRLVLDSRPWPSNNRPGAGQLLLLLVSIRLPA